MEASSSRRLARLAKAPLRALSRFCDWYVRSVTSCATHAHFNPAMAYPAAITPLPASFRLRSDAVGDDDLEELIRVASASSARAAPQPPPTVRKSRSVAIGRIDEDKPCEFGSSDGGVVGSGLLFSKGSRSCAGGGKTVRGLFV